jgi:uncharacterized membrane protein HdeD (DUF308 family)
MYIVAGLIALGAGVTVLIFPGVGLAFLVALLSVGLIFMGAAEITAGAVGETYRVVPTEKAKRLVDEITK